MSAEPIPHGFAGWPAIARGARAFGLRAAWRFVRARWRTWTLLPGDRVHDAARMLDGVVVEVAGTRGRVAVVWATAETLYRHPGMRLDELPTVGLPGGRRPRDVSRYPAIVRDVWREDAVPRWSLSPGWRWTGRRS